MKLTAISMSIFFNLAAINCLARGPIQIFQDCTHLIYLNDLCSAEESFVEQLSNDLNSPEIASQIDTVMNHNISENTKKVIAQYNRECRNTSEK